MRDSILVLPGRVTCSPSPASLSSIPILPSLQLPAGCRSRSPSPVSTQGSCHSWSLVHSLCWGHLLSPYSVAQLQIREASTPPFPHINPQPLLPTTPTLSSTHPGNHPTLQGTPTCSGASTEVPQALIPCLPPPQVPEGFAGVAAGAESPLMKHEQVAAGTAQHKINRPRSLPETDLYREQKV